MRKIATLLFLLAIAAINTAGAQTLPDSMIAKIDNIFKKWNNPNSPGCAVGIIRNDSIIFAKGYGMANLEYGIAITPATPFHMASISKQFTAYSIVLLARQGKLQLDDDIHKYLPWFPQLKQKITIRNLLNHTSGIRDQWQLLAIAGTRLDDVITQDHVIKILSNQKALNFNPGDEYSYSNSGFTMLAEIVRSVSGQSLRQFTDSAIFKPLGMSSTHFHDDYQEIEKGRSYSYQQDFGNHFKNAVLSYSVAGATSLFTNVNDMSKWIINFYNPKSGDAQDIVQLTQKGKLNNGKELSYALGIVSGKYKGWQQFTHDGADAGYRTSLMVLPGLKEGFVVFCNLGSMNAGGLANRVADLLVKDSVTKAPDKEEDSDDDDSSAAILKNPEQVAKYAGNYIAEDGLKINLRLKGQILYSYANGDTDMLVKQAKDTFGVLGSPGFAFIFAQNKPAITLISPDKTYHLEKYTIDTLTDNILQAYTGTYYCPELDCSYRIKLKEHKLVLTNNKYEDTHITLTGLNHLSCSYWWMGHLMITRNSANKITGFEVNDGRIQHLAFTKVE